MPIKPCRWSKGKSFCAYCGINLATSGDHVVPSCLYVPAARKSIKNLLTVPACRACNEDKGKYDGALQHYLLIDVDSSEHPEAQQLFDAKLKHAVSRNRVRLLDQFQEGGAVPEVTPNGLWLRDLYAIPFDFEPLRLAVVYLVRGLHYLVFGEVRQENEVGANVVERGQRNEWASNFLALGIDDWHSQGDVLTVAWTSLGATNIYWMLSFFDHVLFVAKSAKTKPLLGPPSYTLNVPMLANS